MCLLENYPDTHGVNYQLGDASYGAYVYSNVDTNAQYTMGCWSLTAGTTDANMYVSANLVGNNFGAAVNGGGGTNVALTSPGRGFHIAMRTANTVVTLFKNGSVAASSSNTIVARPFHAAYILARNANGATDGPGANTISIAYYGAGNINHTVFYQILQRFAGRQKFAV